MCKTKQIEEKGQIVGANARDSYYLYYLLRFFPNFFSFDTFCILVFLYVFPIMGACCAQIKGFAPISGMWRKVFVKALPKINLSDKFLFSGWRMPAAIV